MTTGISRNPSACVVSGALVLLLAICLAPSVSAVVPAVYNATGVGIVQADDYATARYIANRNALQIAVSSAVGSRLGVELNPIQISKISDRLQNRGAFDAKVISEGAKDGLYTISLSVSIDQAKLEQQLQAFGFVALPKVTVLSNERVGGMRQTGQPAKMTITQVLSENGIRVVDAVALEKIKENDVVRAAFLGDAESVLALGTRHGIDMIVIVDADTQAGTTILNAKSSQATLTAKGIWVATADVAFANTFRANGAGFSFDQAGDKALESASREAADYLLRRVRAANPVHIQLVLRKVGSLTQVNNLISSLIEIPGVVSANIGTFDGSVTMIDVDSLLTVQSFASSLQALQGNSVQVTRVESARIEANLTAK